MNCYAADSRTVRDRVQVLKANGRSIAEVVAATPTTDLDPHGAKGLMTPDDFVSIVYNTLRTNDDGRRTTVIIPCS